MGLNIARTPNGRFYVWNDAVEKGFRCSPFFKTLEEMVKRTAEIDSRRDLLPHRWRNFIRLEYSRGWLPLFGPALKPEDLPEWLLDVDPGVDGNKVPIMERDTVYFFVEEIDDYIKGTVVKRKSPGSYQFEVRTNDTRWLSKTFEESEDYLIKVKTNAR